MNFSSVLSLHRGGRAEHALPDILGDAFLLRENPIYRQVRMRALASGAVYTEATTEYLLLPFNQLERIVASKQIPYVPHARLMSAVEARHPGVFDLQQMPMPESYHLHESAHVVAELCAAGLETSTQEARILRALLCESFANTVDALACGYAETEEHRVFLKLNCYMAPNSETRELMTRVRRAFGPAFTARVVLLSYLFANFLWEDVPVDLLGVDDADVLSLSELGQSLDPLFRVQTTQNFLLMAGFRGEVYDLLSFDFVGLLAREDFSAALAGMIAVLSE